MTMVQSMEESGYGLLCITIVFSIPVLLATFMPDQISAIEYTCSYIASKVYNNTSVVVCNGELFWTHDDTVGTTFQMWRCPFTDDIVYDTEPVCTPNPISTMIVVGSQVLLVIMACASMIMIYAPKTSVYGYIPVKTV